MSILKSIDTRLKRTSSMKLFAIMASSKCTVGFVECTGMLRINFVTKYLIGNFMFQLSTRTSEKLGI